MPVRSYNPKTTVARALQPHLECGAAPEHESNTSDSGFNEM